MNTNIKEIKITQLALDTIKETIKIELLKRGFLAPIEVSVEQGNYPAIKVKSESFQTTPVIFKNVWISNFGGSVKNETITRRKHNDEQYEAQIARFWIDVHVGYEHFDLGSNGCKLFGISGWVGEETYDDRIYDLQLN